MAAEEQTFEERMEERGGIRRVAVDGTVVEADSIQDEIALDKYLREQAQAANGRNPWNCLGRRKIIPPEAG